MDTKTEVKLLYIGPDVNLGRHGAIKKGDVISASIDEALDVQDDERFVASPSDDDVKRVKEEVAKAKADAAKATKALADAQAKLEAAQEATGEN